MIQCCVMCLHCMPNGPIPPMGCHCQVNGKKIPYGSEDMITLNDCGNFMSRYANRDILEWRRFRNATTGTQMRPMPPPRNNAPPIFIPAGAVFLPHQGPPPGAVVNRPIQRAPVPPFR